MINVEAMLIAFKQLGKEALSLDHYELEAESAADYTADEWKEFLDKPEIRDYIQKEMTLIRKSQLNKIIKDAGTSKSMGQSQLLTALNKIDETSKEGEGPVFIYCYVPLNEEQKFANNILEVDEFGMPKTPPISN